MFFGLCNRKHRRFRALFFLNTAYIGAAAAGQPVILNCFESVTIFFSDVVGLQRRSVPCRRRSRWSPCSTTLYNRLRLHHRHVWNVYKVETYPATPICGISGLRSRTGSKHAGHICSMAPRPDDGRQSIRSSEHRTSEQGLQTPRRFGAQTTPDCQFVY